MALPHGRCRRIKRYSSWHTPSIRIQGLFFSLLSDSIVAEKEVRLPIIYDKGTKSSDTSRRLGECTFNGTHSEIVCQTPAVPRQLSYRRAYLFAIVKNLAFGHDLRFSMRNPPVRQKGRHENLSCLMVHSLLRLTPFGRRPSF